VEESREVLFQFAEEGRAVSRGGLTRMEKEVARLVDAKSLEGHLRRYTRRVHIAGSFNNKKLAYFTRDRMRSYGLKSEFDVYKEIQLNRPKFRELIAYDTSSKDKVIYRASLSEEIMDFDSSSYNEYRNVTFFGYGSSGKASGQIVYANYGLPEDFDYLLQNDISIKGKIVLMRFGKCLDRLKKEYHTTVDHYGKRKRKRKCRRYAKDGYCKPKGWCQFVSPYKCYDVDHW
jgi:hypothetical protein